MQFLFLIALLFLAAAIITVINLWQRTDVEDNTKLLWTTLIVVAPFIGMLRYYLFGRRQSSL